MKAKELLLASIITTSALLATAELRVSNATEAGSEPIFCFTTGTPTPVSYTHLDVYKRQAISWYAKAVSQ